MKRAHQPSGLHHSLQLLIDPDWSPEQALAIIELLNDLRDRIWTHYAFAVLAKLRDDRVNLNDPPTTDPPF